MFFLHILILYHLLEEVIFTLYYLYTTTNPRIFEGYGRQKGWEREAPATGIDNGREKTPDGFVEVTEQMELPF